MEPAETTASGVDPPRTRFQSIQDFMKEQDELDVLKAAEAEAHLAANLTKKQKKAALRAEREQLEADRKEKKALVRAKRERLEAEKQRKKTTLEGERLSIEQQANKAVEEVGVVNWVGRLHGNLPPLFTWKSIWLIRLWNTAMQTRAQQEEA